jgi:Xaa-Pro dipeptidase
MADERTQRVAAAARDVGADWAVLTSPDAVYYAVQHAGIIETGPSPFAGGPSVAFIAADGSLTGLLVNNLEEAAARQSSAGEVRTYTALALTQLTPVEDSYEVALRKAIGEFGVGGVVAVQKATCTETIGQALRGNGVRIVSIDRKLDRARSTKTKDEIERLRWCAQLTSIGQRACLAATRAGRSELEIWADVRLAMEQAEGQRMPVAGDLTSGIENTARISGWPTDRVVAEGDPLLCDLAPRAKGYWGDSCNTVFVGEPTKEFMRLHTTTQRALEVAGEVLRPGIAAGELDRLVRDVFESVGLQNAIHTGHGIGTGVHEWPRIVPGQDATIEPGMVLMIEPGAYYSGVGGVRLEWMFLVTEDGNEVLSQFAHELKPASA